MTASPQSTSSSQRFDTVVTSSRGNILIADDEIIVSTPLRKMLLAKGYHVECVETGYDAAQALASGKYELLVADICMPGNNALDVLRTKEIQVMQIPVIVITGHPSVETAVDALRLAVVDYFVKPVPPQAFLDSVEKALERRHAIRTVQEIEERVGNVAAVLQSVRSTLQTAGQPLFGAVEERPAGEDHSLRARLQSDEFAVLSRREREILTMIAKGEGTATVASHLGISVSTVRNHLKSIYRKVGVTSQVSLVRKLLT
jgi:DNA-binding NarL/FixJ family response regulator